MNETLFVFKLWTGHYNDFDVVVSWTSEIVLMPEGEVDYFFDGGDHEGFRLEPMFEPLPEYRYPLKYQDLPF
jgi:hypothetical protein